MTGLSRSLPQLTVQRFLLKTILSYDECVLQGACASDSGGYRRFEYCFLVVFPFLKLLRLAFLDNHSELNTQSFSFGFLERFLFLHAPRKWV